MVSVKTDFTPYLLQSWHCCPPLISSIWVFLSGQPTNLKDNHKCRAWLSAGQLIFQTLFRTLLLADYSSDYYSHNLFWFTGMHIKLHIHVSWPCPFLSSHLTYQVFTSCVTFQFKFVSHYFDRIPSTLLKILLMRFILPVYRISPRIVRRHVWYELRFEASLCIIRPQILDVSSVPGHLNVRHGYYRILLYDAVTQDRYLHTWCSMRGTAATVQLCKTKGQYLLTLHIFSFSTAERISSWLSGFEQTFWGLHKLHIHIDFKIFIFRRQIYIF